MRVFVIGGLAESLINFRGELIRTLADRGHEVTAMAGPAEADVNQRIEARGATFESFPLERDGLNPTADARTFKALTDAFATHMPDVVLAYTIKPVVWGGLAARRNKQIKFFALITGLGTPFMEGGRKRQAIRKVASTLYKAALKNAAGVIFQNPDDRDLLVGLGVIPMEKCHVVHGSGVDIAQFSQSPLPEGHPVFLIVARVMASKGMRDFAEAAAIVHKTHPDAEFRIVGWKDETEDGIPSEELQSWIDSGAVNYAGPTKDVLGQLNQCHIFTLPSYYGEGLPRTILEAMSVGRPILTTDNVGCREPVEEGENGFLVPIKDSAALAERMNWFLDNRDNWSTMANASRRLAEERYDVHRVNASLLEIMGIS